MDAWVLWMLVGIALAAGEIATTSFYLGPFAAGAFLALAADLAGLGWVVQVVAFLVASTVFFTAVRPIARRHIHMPAQIRTGTAALVGKTAIVVERIANDEGAGSVKIGGEVWTARAWDEDQIIEQGCRVQVIEIRGATALVSE